MINYLHNVLDPGNCGDAFTAQIQQSGQNIIDRSYMLLCSLH